MSLILTNACKNNGIFGIGKRGFTLLEVLVTTSLLTIILIPTLGIFVNVKNAVKDSDIVSDMNSSARCVLEIMSNDIASALVVDGNGSYQFKGSEIIANEGELYFVATTNNPNDIDDDTDQIEVGYKLDGSGSLKTLKRYTDKTIDGTSPLTDGTATDLAHNVTKLNFEYYVSSWTAGTYDSTTPNPDTVPKAVKIELSVRDENQKVDERTYTLVVYIPSYDD